MKVKESEEEKWIPGRAFEPSQRVSFYPKGSTALRKHSLSPAEEGFEFGSQNTANTYNCFVKPAVLDILRHSKKNKNKIHKLKVWKICSQIYFKPKEENVEQDNLVCEFQTAMLLEYWHSSPQKCMLTHRIGRVRVPTGGSPFTSHLTFFHCQSYFLFWVKSSKFSPASYIFPLLYLM